MKFSIFHIISLNGHTQLSHSLDNLSQNVIDAIRMDLPFRSEFHN